MILSIDPSSTKTGYAVLNGARLEEAGVVRGERTRDPALERTIAMAGDLFELVTRYSPEKVIIEMPGSGPGTGSRRGASSSLIAYGVACGYLYARMAAIRTHMGFDLVPVQVNTWTAGWKKTARQAAVMAMFPAYRPEVDKGMDCSDAIALGWWYLMGEKKPENSA